MESMLTGEKGRGNLSGLKRKLVRLAGDPGLGRVSVVLSGRADTSFLSAVASGLDQGRYDW